MKKINIGIITLCLISAIAYIAQAATTQEQAVATAAAQPAAAAGETALSGIIIDNNCAGAHTSDIAEFSKTHTKDCALMPACQAAGYSLYANGKLVKFDKGSNAKVVEFLKNPSSKTQVTVSAKMSGDELSLASIENQK